MVTSDRLEGLGFFILVRRVFEVASGRTLTWVRRFFLPLETGRSASEQRGGRYELVEHASEELMGRYGPVDYGN